MMTPVQILKQMFAKPFSLRSFPVSSVQAPSALLAVAIFASLLTGPSSFALTPQVQQLVHDETQANAVARRSEAPVAIEHYEIPYRLIAHDVASRTPKDVLEALLFKKKGETYIRWVINPEDTKWHLEVEKWMLAKGIKPTKFKYFTGYQTASRSYIVEDPKTHAQFSVKVSTDHTGGNWRDKKQEWSDVQQIRGITDFIMARNQANPAADIIIMDEPAGFGIADLDQGMVVRLLGDLPNGTNRYVPGFSVMENKLGKELATENGAKDIAAFWNKNYNIPLARGTAELLALAGITYDSPHSQNFLVELDSHDQPTGRIVFRDFGDSYLTKEFFEAAGAMDVYDNWESHNKLTGRFSVGIGILHGNTSPGWLTDAQYEQWAHDFFQVFEAELKKEIGRTAQFSQRRESRSGAYFNKTYDASSPSWQNYLSTLHEGSAAVTEMRCEAIFN